MLKQLIVSCSLALIILSFNEFSYAEESCPGGMLTEKGAKPFHIIPLGSRESIIFCGYAGEIISDREIHTSEYSVFKLPSKERLLSFSAIEKTRIHLAGKNTHIITLHPIFQNLPDDKYDLSYDKNGYYFNRISVLTLPEMNDFQVSKLRKYLSGTLSDEEYYTIEDMGNGRNWEGYYMYVLLAQAAMDGNSQAEAAMLNYRDTTLLDGEGAETANEVDAMFDSYLRTNRSFSVTENLSLMTLVKKISSSSNLIETKPSRFAYHPTNSFDQDSNTAWFEGVEGQGVGEYLEYDLFSPVDISSFSISNGYGKSEKTFRNNGRIKTLELLLNDKNKITISLDDTILPQKVVRSLKEIRKIRLTIKDVYAGAKFKDTGLSEFSIQATLSPRRITQALDATKLEELYKAYVSETDFTKEQINFFSNITAKQLSWVLSEKNKVDSSSLLKITKILVNHSELLPTLIASIYDPTRSHYFFERSNEKYLIALNLIWPNGVESIPLISHGAFKKDYYVYHHLISQGDTRFIPEFLFRAEREPWKYKNCCKYDPIQLLRSTADEYTVKSIGKFFDDKKRYSTDKELRNGEYSEMSKLYESLKK